MTRRKDPGSAGYCGSCGAAVEQAARFCGACGAGLDDQQTAMRPPGGAKDGNDDTGQDQRKRGGLFARRGRLVLLSAGFGFVVVAAAVVLVATSRMSERTVALDVTAEDGARVTLGDEIALVIPPGVLSADTTVTITNDPEGRLPATPRSWGSATPVGDGFHVDLGDAHLTGPLTLEVAVDAGFVTEAGDDDDKVLALASYDPEDQAWVSVATTIDGSVLRAEVDHLSWWRPWLLWIPTTGARMWDQIIELFPTDPGVAVEDPDADVAREEEVGIGFENLEWSRLPHIEALSGGSGGRIWMHSVTAGGPGLVAVGREIITEPSGDRFVGVVWTSPDGVTWSRLPHDETVFGNAWLWSVTAGGPGLVAVGLAWTGDKWGAMAWTSPDGRSWSRGPYDEAVFGSDHMRSVAAGGPGLIAVGADSPGDPQQVTLMWSSSDGVTWSRVPVDEAVFGDAVVLSVTAGGPGLVAVGSNWPVTEVALQGPGEPSRAMVWTSPDGVTWSRVPHDEAALGDSAMTSVTAADQGLVAVGGYRIGDSGGTVLWTSPDGITWSRGSRIQAVNVNNVLDSVTAWGEGLVGVGGEARTNEPDVAAVWIAEPGDPAPSPPPGDQEPGDPEPVPPPADDEPSFSREEESFRRLLEREARPFPVRPFQRVGHVDLMLSLDFVLTDLCELAWLKDRPDLRDAGVALCAGDVLVTEKWVGQVLNRFARDGILASLGAVHPYSAGGKVVLAAVKVGVARTLSPDPDAATFRTLAVEVAAAQFPEAVSRYLLDASAALAEEKIDSFIADLRGDDLTTGEVSKLVPFSFSKKLQDWLGPRGNIETSLSYVYSPHTHELVAYLSVETQPDRVYVVSYRVAQRSPGAWRKAEGTATTCFYVTIDGVIPHGDPPDCFPKG